MSPSTLIRTFCCLLLGALAGPALAAPGLLSYQGRMTDSRGLPINTQVTVVFSFFDAPTSGALLGNGWFDSDSVWPDKNGVYTTMIGDDNNPIPPGIFDCESVYLQVVVNNEFLSPRQRITASPYAINTGHTRTYVAAEAIKAGDVVMATSDGKIKKAKEPGAASYTDINLETTTGYSFKNLVRLSPTRFAAAYQPQGMGIIMLYTVNANGTLTAAKIYFWQGLINSILPLPNGQLLIAYRERTTGKSMLVAGTPGDVSIAFGTPLPQIISAYFPLAQDKLVIIDSSNYAMKIKVASVQNGTITMLASLDDPDAPGPTMSYLGGCVLDDNRIACVAYTFYETVRSANMCVFTFNGSSLQAGAWTKLKTLDGPQLPGPTTLSTVDQNKALLYWAGEGLQVVNFNGDAPVLGELIALPNTVSNPPVTAYPVAKNLALMAKGHSLCTLTINGASVVYSPVKRYASNFGKPGAPCFFDASRILSWTDGSESFYFHGPACIPLSSLDEVMDDWVGVAEETVATGKPCRVTIGGGVSRQFSALKPGRTYMLTPTGLKIADLSVLTSAEQSLLIGKALSANELLLK